MRKPINQTFISDHKCLSQSLRDHPENLLDCIDFFEQHFHSVEMAKDPDELHEELFANFLKTFKDPTPKPCPTCAVTTAPPFIEPIMTEKSLLRRMKELVFGESDSSQEWKTVF